MTPRSLQRLALALMTGGLLFTFAACGSSSAIPTTTAPVPPATTASTSTTALTPSGSIGPQICSTAILQATATFGGAAAGSSYYTLSVKNTGRTACALDGYPQYEFFAPSGAGGAGAGPRVSISESDRGPSASQVLIEPGSTADSIIVYSDVASGGSNCPAIASALLTPPRSSESIAFPISFSPCDGSVQVYAFGEAGSENP